jgi:hypothetical protein
VIASLKCRVLSGGAHRRRLAGDPVCQVIALSVRPETPYWVGGERDWDIVFAGAVCDRFAG